jgi:hypothetical protein
VGEPDRYRAVPLNDGTWTSFGRVVHCVPTGVRSIVDARSCERPTHLAATPSHVDVLIALALDLLAHAEASHRAANRLEVATRALARNGRERGVYDSTQARQVREHVAALEDMAQTHRNLLTEFSRELDTLLGEERRS